MIRTAIYMTINMGSSIFCVMSNKWIYVLFDFREATTLTCFHFVLTFIGLYIAASMKVFEAKKLSVLKVLPICVSFCGFIVLTNISLVYNSVGTTQIIKSLSTPIILFIETTFYNKKFPLKVKLAVVIILLGVTLTNYGDAEFNLPGTIYGTVGSVSTALYYVWVGSKQKEFECNSMQLLLYQAPISAAMLVLAIPFFDSLHNLVTFDYSNMAAMALILLSGILALAVNLSTYMVIGHTSAVTYQVLGYMKMLTSVTLGALFFQTPMSWIYISGLLITFGGIVLYTHLKLAYQNQEKEKALALPEVQPLKEKDKDTA